MSHKNKVLKSVNIADGQRCVDVFVRPDGSFGYEEFRRAVEDARGWFPIGRYAEKSFGNADEALSEALATVSWLNEALANP